MTPIEPPLPPWETPVIGVELVIIEPVLDRLLFLERKPDVRLPAPMEAVVGHVALRLVDDGPAASHWMVGVSAYMDLDHDGRDDPSNLFRGLFGGYDLRFAARPLGPFTEAYAFDEGRSMRRYPVPMTDDEIAVLLDGLREASVRGEAHELGSYWFFHKNCATELTRILDRAVLGKPRALNVPTTLPRKYARRGIALPLVADVFPEQTATGAFDALWAIPPALLTVCDDADCAATWTAAAASVGPEWLDLLARDLRRHGYERRWSPEVRAAVAEAARGD